VLYLCLVKALVTGGAGFIGSHLVRYLLEKGHEVVVLDDLSGGYMENIPKNALFVKGSIADYQLVQSLFEKYRFNYVYHLAAYAAEGLSHFIRRFNYENNVIGSVNIINQCILHQVECLVFTSSIAVYGAQEPPMREDMTPQPIDPYGIAKYAVELDLKAAKEVFGLNYIIFRPHNVYGEYQNIADRYRNVVGIFMNQILQGKPLTIFGDGTQTRAFTYVGDIVPIIAESVFVPDAYNEVFNIGGDTFYSVNELARVVMEVMGKEVPIRYLPPRHEALHAYSDHSKVRKVFGERPHTPLREGLARMAAWVKEVGARATPRFENIEIYRNLPTIWLE
jgi:UDP-glucose 4-epimerase